MSSLRQLELQSLLEPELITALIVVTDGQNELRGFRQLFIGLKGLLEFSTGDTDDW